MSKVLYDVFSNYINILEEKKILKRQKIYGYKKVFKDLLFEYNLIYQIKGMAIYIKSIINGEIYCLTNGKFTEHLRKNKITQVEYLTRCNVVLPVGYVLTFQCDGKETKEHIVKNYGKEFYFMYRSILTSVSSDFRKLMLFYGISEEEAKKIERNKYEKYSQSHKGVKNNSYGKKGLNANCFRPFMKADKPRDEYSQFLKERNKKYILKWASDHDIDEISYEKVKFLYYSTCFKNIHIKKGVELKKKFGLETIEQGIYAFSKQKSLDCYNAKNFLEYNSKIINSYGSEYDKNIFLELLREEKYDQIMSLRLGIEHKGFPKRCKYFSKKYGKFSLRSKLEKGFLFIIDRLSFVKLVKYEEIKIPYNDGKKDRLYYIDFEVTLNDNKKLLIEVKPYKLCIIPEGEILLKSKAAIEYANKNNYKYLFMTEKEIKKYDNVIKKLQSA